MFDCLNLLHQVLIMTKIHEKLLFNLNAKLYDFIVR